MLFDSCFLNCQFECRNVLFVLIWKRCILIKIALGNVECKKLRCLLSTVALSTECVHCSNDRYEDSNIAEKLLIP